MSLDAADGPERMGVEHEGAPAGQPYAVPYDERFLALSWEWLNDPLVKKLSMTPVFTKKQQLEWFSGLSKRTDYVIWGIELDQIPVGAFGLKGIDGESAEPWGYVGEKAYWKKGIGTWIWSEAIGRAKAMGLKRLRSRVWRDNPGAIRLNVQFGFSDSGMDGDVRLMELVLTGED